MPPCTLPTSRGSPWTLVGSPGTVCGRKGRKNFSPGTERPCENSSPPSFAFPLHPREPRRHASHKARHRGGPGAKEDIDTKAKKGIRVYLERRGFEILEEDWARGGDVADFIARDEDDLLFVHCQITQNGGEGFPEEDADRAALERLPAANLAEHLDSEDIRIRFDVVSVLIVGESRALFRHHLNALGRSKRRVPPGALKAACSAYRAMMTVTNPGIIFSRSRLRPVGFRTSLPGS